MNPRYPENAARARHRCEYCQAPEAISNLPFEVEHIVPRSLGGDTEEENLALACRSCNLHKSNHVVAVEPLTNEMVPLFHPRRERWTEHFAPDTATGKIIGKTSVGRATIGRLQMNSDHQVAARLLWIRLGLYP